MEIKKEPFGVLANGGQAHLFTVSHENGTSVVLTDMGASLRSIMVPDKNGRLTDVALSFGSFEDSAENRFYFGSTCGRVANRIGDAKFTLNGKEYKLTPNHPEFQLHGGVEGYSHKLWSGEILDDGVKFTLCSPDGDQGFPGTLDVSVTYRWNGAVLSLDYDAVSDADTIVNLTNHTYFNLDGHDSGDILGHTVKLDCSKFLPIKSNVCVTGEIRPVAGTCMDFTEPHTIGERINCGDTQLEYAKGYDFCYVLDGSGFCRCAEVTGDKSGITMSVYTDKPSVHLYTGGHLTSSTGKNGARYDQAHGFCLETQFFPDAINQPQFGHSSVLKAGERYKYRTEYRFG